MLGDGEDLVPFIEFYESGDSVEWNIWLVLKYLQYLALITSERLDAEKINEIFYSDSFAYFSSNRKWRIQIEAKSNKCE